MGRYIEGDIAHKLWFGVQPSDAPEVFGAIPIEQNVIEYAICLNDFNLDKLIELIDELNNHYTSAHTITLETEPEEIYDWFPFELHYCSKETRQLELLYANVILGLKIYQRLLKEKDPSTNIYFTSEL